MKKNGSKKKGNGGKSPSFTVSDAIVERLAAWGVRRIYGFPGDGINSVLGALRRAGDRIEFIQVAHEELAGMAACAHAKFTGELGVCLSTGGPGFIHMLNGMYDAKLDHMPLLAIVGQQAMAGIGGSEQQEVDLLPLAKDVASAYVEALAKPSSSSRVPPLQPSASRWRARKFDPKRNRARSKIRRRSVAAAAGARRSIAE